MDVIVQAPVDLTFCDLEPIHIPGSIQPHGVMLVVDPDGLQVRYTAGDVESKLGMTEWQNLPLSAFIGPALSAKVAALKKLETEGSFIGQFESSTGTLLDVSAQISDAHIIVELETMSEEEVPVSLVLDRLAVAAAGFGRAASIASLCDRAAVEFRRLTGFDRVMVYRFIKDGAGKVLAESKRDELTGFLNHHFPASDIPQQARALYIRNPIRVISDVEYEPALLQPNWAEALPLDMGDCNFRSVSPIHLQYLRNMGVGASASISIVKDGALWGLVACHNKTPRDLTHDVRAACVSLAGSLALQIKVKDEANGYRERIRLHGFQDEIAELLSREEPLEAALSNHLGEIGRMMNADGIAILRGSEFVLGGICPSSPDIRDLAAWLFTLEPETVFSSDELSLIYPPAATFHNLGSGVLAVILSASDPWVLIWFRVEQAEVVNWAGNPHKSINLNPNESLTPRSSFEAWQEAVRGRSLAWSLAEIDAAKRLRVTLLDIQQNRRIRTLNHQLTVILGDKDVLLRQNEFLIGEVNHRVQNSLQLVSSFLALQAKASNSLELKNALEEARRRLTAVALVHRRLYRGDNIGTVDAARYIEELCADTVTFMGEDWATHLSLELSPIMITTDLAVPLSLLLTELLINCNKHAYGGQPGPIEIQLTGTADQLQLIVADKGIGSTFETKGFGSKIVANLIKQLGGSLDARANSPGLRTIITIPVQKPSRSKNAPNM